MVIPFFLGAAIDEALDSGIRIQLLLFAGAIILMGLLKAFFNYGTGYLSEALSQRVAYDLRHDFFQKLQTLSFGFYDRQQTGNLMSMSTIDVEAMRQVISFGLIQGFSGLLRFVIAAAFMLTIN